MEKYCSAFPRTSLDAIDGACSVFLSLGLGRWKGNGPDSSEPSQFTGRYFQAKAYSKLLSKASCLI
jgi:hypothetical protein